MIWVLVGTFTATTHCWKGRRGILNTDQYGCRQLCAACAGVPAWASSLGSYSRLQGVLILIRKPLARVNSGVFILK